jgi:DNA repair exonuclease SbcCD nuclease subunit
MVDGKKPIRLLHTSDLHIGIDIYSEGAMRGFEAVIELARDNRADAVLIAGDLFDDSFVPLPTVKCVLQELERLDRPVVILPGNHDTVLTRGEFTLEIPDRVSVLKRAEGDLASYHELGLAVWGRPVYDHSPEFHPLEGLPRRPESGWYVSMAHGLFMDSFWQPWRSSPISPEELGQAPCDYIALGHVHVFRDVSQNGVPAFYSGAPSGSQAKTAALVDLVPGQLATVTPLPVS